MIPIKGKYGSKSVVIRIYLLLGLHVFLKSIVTNDEHDDDDDDYGGGGI